MSKSGLPTELDFPPARSGAQISERRQIPGLPGEIGLRQRTVGIVEFLQHAKIFGMVGDRDEIIGRALLYRLAGG